MKILILALTLFITACNPLSNEMVIKHAHMIETPATFPAAAIFMEIKNNTDTNDRMIDFKTDRAGRVELHTMAMDNDIMRMRRVEGYDVASGDKHTLKHMADHIMVFDMTSDFIAGETFQGTAIFEKSGEIPVTITVKSRNDAHQHDH